MDDMLAKAAVASQRLNTYTGTDYSGIEVLRNSIIEQERIVRACHATVSQAKDAYTTAHSQQAASQKEVVGLLERKQSWASGDLERYMSLIRSEHINEQAVQKSQDDLADAEKALAEARSSLEKRERRQYHEEQIWSDTIRRNSTWVTFGLMGLNIFLLLANLVIIEPWRRRRMVREFRTALEEKTMTGPMPAVETAADQIVEVFEAPNSTDTNFVSDSTVLAGQPIPVAVNDQTRAENAASASADTGSQEVPEVAESDGGFAGFALPNPAASGSWDAYKERFRDLFSERPVSLKRVDVTTIALEGAAAGVALMGFLFVLLRPR